MIMDPDCAICSQPALAQCDCEAKGLDLAVRQAEQRMMDSHFRQIRYLFILLPFPFFPSQVPKVIHTPPLSKQTTN